jgi:integrase
VKTRERQPAPEALTAGEIHDHLSQTLAGSKWEQVRGLHTLRHSAASFLAGAGVDQRVIDDMLGHDSEEMRRRHRRLTPEFKSQAVLSVFV